MKFTKLSQLILVSTIGLAIATLLTACQIVTIDYLFVADNSTAAGQISTYAVDSESGAIRSVATPVAAGGAPVAMATTSDYAHLYVANASGNSVGHYTIAADGSLKLADSVTLSDTPVYLAVNQAGTYLYVVYGSASATLAEYPLSSGKIGTVAATETLSLAGFSGDVIVPTGVNVLASNAGVYVTAYDQSAYNPGGVANSSANPGWVFGFAVGSGGALTPTANSPYKAGVKPSAIVSDPTNLSTSLILPRIS